MRRPTLAAEGNIATPAAGRLQSAEAALRVLIEQRAGTWARLFEAVAESYALSPEERAELGAKLATELHVERIKVRLAGERSRERRAIARRVAGPLRVGLIAGLLLVGCAFVVTWALDVGQRATVEAR